ncbi:MAG: bifunctional hydroxymethylpyrimidine kinase/phosphomethylpyrimidine kinase [Acidimicrobiales bacterium]
MTDRVAVALTIAGSDSGGGAGIQADLTTFAAFDVHGTSVVTALTAQNTVEVAAIHVPPIEFLEAQLDTVLGDLPVAAVKTGMLATEEIIRAVAVRAAAGQLPNLVVDPVLVAASGARLLDAGAEAAYVETLFAHAQVVTPNVPEASVLCEGDIRTIDDMRAAAEGLAGRGPAWVVVKGGHRTGNEAIDVLYERATRQFTELRAPRIEGRNNHGSGCTFASAIAAMLARSASVSEAVAAAKRHVTAAMRASAPWRLGAGHGPVSHLRRDATSVEGRNDGQ